MTLKTVIANNPQIRDSAIFFKIGPCEKTAQDLARSICTIAQDLNGESVFLFRAARILFAIEKFQQYRAKMFEEEAKKHNTVENSLMAANEYMKVADLTQSFETKIDCLKSAFYCALKAKKPMLALEAAKIIHSFDITQGMATLYYDAAKICEGVGDKKLARDFYFEATEGDYKIVKKAKEAWERLPKNSEMHEPIYSEDSRFSSKHD